MIADELNMNWEIIQYWMNTVIPRLTSDPANEFFG